MKNVIIAALIPVCFISCSTSTSDKETELLKRENELLKRENELAKKEKESENKKNSTLEDIDRQIEGFKVDLKNENYVEQWKEKLIGQKIRKGIYAWRCVSVDEFSEFKILNTFRSGNKEITEISTLLTDIHGNGNKYYAKIRVTTAGSYITDIETLDYSSL